MDKVQKYNSFNAVYMVSEVSVRSFTSCHVYHFISVSSSYEKYMLDI